VSARTRLLASDFDDWHAPWLLFVCGVFGAGVGGAVGDLLGSLLDSLALSLVAAVVPAGLFTLAGLVFAARLDVRLAPDDGRHRD
jgi:hypothetical protein